MFIPAGEIIRRIAYKSMRNSFSMHASGRVAGWGRHIPELITELASQVSILILCEAKARHVRLPYGERQCALRHAC